MHAATPLIDDDRGVKNDAAAPRRGEQSRRVHLAIEGQVDGNTLAGRETRQARQDANCVRRVALMVRGIEGAARAAQFFAQRGFKGWRYPQMPFWTVAPDLSNRWG